MKMRRKSKYCWNSWLLTISTKTRRLLLLNLRKMTQQTSTSSSWEEFLIWEQGTTKLKKLITSRSSLSQVRSFQPLPQQLPWSSVQSVSKSSSIWLERKLTLTKMWPSTWLSLFGFSTIPLKLSWIQTNNSIQSCADPSRSFQTVLFRLYRIYKMAENQYKRSNDSWRLQESLWENIQYRNINDHIRNSHYFLIIRQISKR